MAAPEIIAEPPAQQIGQLGRARLQNLEKEPGIGHLILVGGLREEFESFLVRLGLLFWIKVKIEMGKYFEIRKLRCQARKIFDAVGLMQHNVSNFVRQHSPECRLVRQYVEQPAAYNDRSPRNEWL